MKLADETKRVARVLPLNGLIASQAVHAVLSWRKQKEWRNSQEIKDSERIEVLVEGAGKVTVVCEHINESQIKKQILQDKQERDEL